MNYRLLTTIAAACSFCLFANAQQSTTGQWQNGPMLPFFPVHMHQLPTGKLMMWPGDNGISGNDPRLFDPATGTITQLALPGYDVFCSGHSLLPDGRLFVAGGHISNNYGLASASIYDPVNNAWIRQPNMNLGRWYPTDQLLPNGDVVVLSGDVDTSTGNDPLPQVWQAATGTWRSLTGAQLQNGLYPTLSLGPNGKVFDSGPSVTTRYLDTTGTGAWTSVGDHVFQGYRDYGGMVMYQPGKILVAGGSDPATNTAEIIDLNAAVPAWKATASMATARRQMNATMLPDGKVLVTGGTSGPGFSNTDPSLAAFTAEEWDPATGLWTTLASATVPRLYHSMAMLLPDGRVLTTGGNGYTQTELFSPPYLFAGARPTITSAPTNVATGQSMFVGTPDAAGITSVSWMRLASNTHGLSMSQAFYSSTSVAQASGGITITSPNDPTLPQGYYMLFLLKNGVPSIASIVHLGSMPVSHPAPAITSLSPTTGVQGDPPMDVTINGSNFSDISFAQWNGQARVTTYISPTQLSIRLPAADLLSAGTGKISVVTPAPGGGSSTTLTFTVTQPAVPNLTQNGTIIARVTAPIGGGSRNLEIIRDGDMPPVGNMDPIRQYDTYSGGAYAAEDWIGYQYATPQTFAKVVFQEGKNYTTGGWFLNLNVQVRQNGTWVNVPGVVSSPAYPPNDAINYETYTFTFPSVTGDAIRIDGAPGGSESFMSVAELQVFGPAGTAPPPPPPAPVPTVSSISPSSASNGDSPFLLTVTGTNFSASSAVQWNGASLPTTYTSATQLVASVPAAKVASVGTAQVTVAGTAGASSSALTFTINQAPVPNLTQTGTIIARVTAPVGGGSRNLEVIRDGDMPAVGNTDSARQYDTYSGGAPAADDWIGYQYSAPQTFGKVVFQEGKNFPDGGWFQNLNIQVRQNGVWTNVPSTVSSPAYPPNDGINFETYTLTFPAVTGDAIRIDGAPGGSQSFISVGELQVYGSGSAPPPASTPAPNLTTTGTIIARVMAPIGGGSRNLEVIRDGDMPPVGTADSLRQYDSYNGGAYAAEDWIGYQYSGQQSFAKVIFQEGRNFADGGWFLNLNVQVRQNGTWVNVPGVVTTPAYPANDGINFETYTLTFPTVNGDAIRIDGAPGGSQYFVSVGELQVFGPAGTASSPPAAQISALSPASANNGDSPFLLTVTGTNFSTNSVVQWNGVNLPTTYTSPTQVVASVPAADVASVGTAQVTIASTAGASSSAFPFPINQAPVPNLTQTGTIIARVTAPIGGGSRNLEVIRDGDKPPVGNTDSTRQYDTFSGGAYAAEDWIGYQYSTPQTFAKVVFQKGKNFTDGGWFQNLNIQVRQNSVWVNVPNVVVSPAYAANDGINFESYTFTFPAITGDAIRIDGAPGGSQYFISVGELQVYGR